MAQFQSGHQLPDVYYGGAWKSYSRGETAGRTAKGKKEKEMTAIIIPFPVTPKPKTFRSEPYLAFAREHKCEMCGLPSNGLPKPENNIVAHHEGLGLNMMGGKPPDSHIVPLCWGCHAIRHAPNWVDWNVGRVDIKMAIIKLLTEYLSLGKD